MTLAALMFLHDGFEEIEAITPLDLLRRAGVAVTTAACGESLRVTGRSGIVIEADAHLADLAADARFALLVVPGGPAVHQGLRGNGEVRSRLQQQAAAGGWIGAICAGPLVLLDAGLLTGKRFTAHFSALAELGEPCRGEVVTDGCLITSQGAGTAVPFGLAMITALCGAATADDVARSICWPTPGAPSQSQDHVG